MDSREIKFKYLVGEGPEVAPVIQAAREAAEAHNARISECLQKYGADCLWGGSRSAPGALGWKWESENHRERPPMRENFLKPTVERDSAEGRFAIYKPDQRYKAGKVIKKDLIAVGNFYYSDYVGKLLKIDRCVFGVLDGRQGMCSTSVGKYGDIIVARVPVGGDHHKENFTLPAGFREIKKSEFIALTEEGE